MVLRSLYAEWLQNVELEREEKPQQKRTYYKSISGGIRFIIRWLEKGNEQNETRCSKMEEQHLNYSEWI